MKIKLLLSLIGTIMGLLLGLILLPGLAKRSNILGTKVVVVPIDKESVVFNPDAELKYFYEPAPGIEKLNQWVPYQGVYTINSDSLNERYDYLPEKPNKTYRIIMLGDSFTYGLYVDTEDNYSEQLEDLLNNQVICQGIEKFEVINLGVHGYDIQYSLKRYKLRGQKYNPDLVVWLLKDDDLVQVNEIMFTKERDYAKTMRESGEWDRQVKQGNFYPSWKLAMQETYREIGEENILKLQIQFLEEFVKLSQKPLLIFTFPHTKNNYKDFLRQFTNSSPDLLFYDGIENIYKFEEAVFPSDGHPTKVGHQMIARDLLDYLTTEKIIPCD